MRNVKFVIISIGLLYLLSCKKEAKTETPAPVASQAANLISGGFIYQQNISRFLPSVTNATAISCTAFFFNPAINPDNSFGVSYADVGSVSINSITLKKYYLQPGVPNYIDSTYAINSSPVTVSISGNNGFTATNFTDNNFPSISNFNQFTDSVSKSAGLTIVLSNLINTTIAEVKFNNIELTTNSNSVTFTASQLSNMVVNSNYALRVKCTNAPPPINLGGKNFNCAYTTEYILYNIVIKN